MKTERRPWLQKCGLLMLALVPIFSACVQRMGKEGHIRPLDGDPTLKPLSGRPPDGSYAQDEELPSAQPPLSLQLLQKGREQFNVNCMPCHGLAGYGDGMVVQRGFLAPPSFHSDRLRALSDQHFFAVISKGYGAMASFADHVSMKDRWAIIAYIRALQLSQHAPRSKLEEKDIRALSGGEQ